MPNGLNLPAPQMGVPGLQGPYASAPRPRPQYSGQLAPQNMPNSIKSWMAGLGGGRRAEAGKPEAAMRKYKTAASYEGTADYAEQKARELATFKDQPGVIQSLIEEDTKLKRWGKAYLKALLGMEPMVSPETLSPAARASTFRSEGQFLESQLPSMRGKLGPEGMESWTQALTPYMGQQGYPTVGAPQLGSPEEKAAFGQFATELFGGVPTTRGQAAGQMVRGEPVSPVPEKFAKWTEGPVSLGQIDKAEQALAAFLTEGPEASMGAGQAAGLLALDRPGLEKKQLMDYLGYESVEDYDPKKIKSQPFMARLAAFVSLVNNVRMKETTTIFIWQDWFKDWSGGRAKTPGWAGFEFPGGE